MITTEAELDSTRAALNELKVGALAPKRKRATIHLERFRRMIEPFADHIRRVRSEIDEYLGIGEPVVEGAATVSTDR